MIIILFVIVVVVAVVVVKVESSSGSSGRGVEVLSSRNGKNNNCSTKNSSRVVKVLRCKHSPVALCVMK